MQERARRGRTAGPKKVNTSASKEQREKTKEKETLGENRKSVDKVGTVKAEISTAVNNLSSYTSLL